jgi:hypothetical protein
MEIFTMYLDENVVSSRNDLLRGGQFYLKVFGADRYQANATLKLIISLKGDCKKDFEL